MDLVLIESLGVDTVIGVYDWERTITQRLVLDLELATDIRPAAADDDIALTLDYAAISEHIAAFAAATTSPWWRPSPSAWPTPCARPSASPGCG
jgi:7,8-dihydroneopterin aldolase/epimerase/oxygenase